MLVFKLFCDKVTIIIFMSRLLMQKTMHFSAWMNAILSTRELLNVTILLCREIHKRFLMHPKTNKPHTLVCGKTQSFFDID